MDDSFVLGERTFRSRLILGTGKGVPFPDVGKIVDQSGAEIVTVAVRRVNLNDTSENSLLRHVDPQKVAYLPNTAGCYTAKDAVLTCELAREALDTNFVKLEVIGDPKTLFPDTAELVVAAKELVDKGFIVLPYTNDDPVVAKRLEDVGCAAVMPLGAPIGSGLGIRNPHNIRIILESAKIPVIVDAGVGTASDASFAMEMGCDAVLMNTGIYGAKDPLKMAAAMRHAIEAGRLAYLAGRIPKKSYATASSPLEELVEPVS